MDNQQFTPTQNQNPAPAEAAKNDKNKLLIILLVVLLIAGIGGMYYWLNGKNGDLTAKLNSAEAEVNTLKEEIASLKADETDTEVEEELEAQTETNDPNPDLIPGNTDTSRTDDRVLIDAVFKYSLKPTAVWVEYGTSPDNLDKATEKKTSGLGMGEPGATYSQGFNVEISSSVLQPGGIYYYRTAATINGQTERGPIASFVTTK